MHIHRWAKGQTGFDRHCLHRGCTSISLGTFLSDYRMFWWLLPIVLPTYCINWLLSIAKQTKEVEE